MKTHSSLPTTLSLTRGQLQAVILLQEHPSVFVWKSLSICPASARGTLRQGPLCSLACLTMQGFAGLTAQSGGCGRATASCLAHLSRWMCPKASHGYLTESKLIRASPLQAPVSPAAVSNYTETLQQQLWNLHGFTAQWSIRVCKGAGGTRTQNI